MKVRRVRYTQGKPVILFERRPGMRAVALDCAVYAIGAKAALTLNFAEQEAELGRDAPPTSKARPPVIRSSFMSR
jgi:hypothetical protein